MCLRNGPKRIRGCWNTLRHRLGHWENVLIFSVIYPRFDYMHFYAWHRPTRNTETPLRLTKTYKFHYVSHPYSQKHTKFYFVSHPYSQKHTKFHFVSHSDSQKHTKFHFVSLRLTKIYKIPLCLTLRLSKKYNIPLCLTTFQIFWDTKTHKNIQNIF